VDTYIPSYASIDQIMLQMALPNLLVTLKKFRVNKEALKPLYSRSGEIQGTVICLSKNTLGK
jgi:hypothetical protein